ncbi:hypothetical protein KD146_17475 [Devosia sp. BSSL-BM10]|uniref:Uncharacterized protein n=1 Tax=Devosia litorisediminis TaxID=2829817 RepID=A0A942I7S4_9HYPH|nr:hypothetical protein [Devosia litorisediminis]MBS3850493.1 hypothetical protein [Devosia litorisediminis]
MAKVTETMLEKRRRVFADKRSAGRPGLDRSVAIDRRELWRRAHEKIKAEQTLSADLLLRQQ